MSRDITTISFAPLYLWDVISVTGFPVDALSPNGVKSHLGVNAYYNNDTFVSIYNILISLCVLWRQLMWSFNFVPFRLVAAPVCGRFGLWPFRFVAAPVCGRFGLWPLSLWPFRFLAVSIVAVSVCGRYDLLHIARIMHTFSFVLLLVLYCESVLHSCDRFTHIYQDWFTYNMTIV